jgi:hypothetical protein
LGKYAYLKIHCLVLQDEYNTIPCNCELGKYEYVSRIGCTVVGRLSFQWTRCMYLVQQRAFLPVDGVHVPCPAEENPSDG